MTASVVVSGDDRTAVAPRTVRALRTLWGAITSVALAVAALGGGVAIIAALAPIWGFHTVLLQTGSMSPDYPAGSVLVARDTPAQDVQVGDIVTVARSDGAVVTHRAVAIETIPGGASLTLRGDANTTDDPKPYVAQRVGIVAGGIPWGGQVVAAIQQPGAVPVIAGAVSLLVLWAWWPTRARPAHRRGSGGSR